MDPPKAITCYSQPLSLTYKDAKMLSRDISRINKEIKAVLRDYNFEYQSFNPNPLPLCEQGLVKLRERIVSLHRNHRISLRPLQVFELVCETKEFLNFKQELKSFIDSLRMEIRIPDEEIEFQSSSTILKKWIPGLCCYGIIWSPI